MRWRVMLSDIDIGEEEIRAVVNVLKSKWLSMGEVTRRFEEEFSKYIGARFAFAVSSGTAALHIACRALGLGPGDEVIVPSLTFVATANVVLYCGAKPVFADVISEDDLTISPDDVLEKITDKTKAIIVVHYAGYPCKMKEISEIAEDYGIKVIEDCAHAIGAEYMGKKCGVLGDVGCFSFFANKNLVTGEGGMVVTNDEGLAEKIRLLRSHGMTTLTWDRYKGHAYTYDVVELGYNYRISEIESAIGLVQLRKLDANNSKRGELTKLYRTLLQDTDVHIPFKSYRGKPSYHILPILLPEDVDRAAFMRYMRDRGIQTSIHYRPIHLFTYYRRTFGFRSGMLPVTEDVARREVTLPLHPLMSGEDVEYVCRSVKEFFEDEGRVA